MPPFCFSLCSLYTITPRLSTVFRNFSEKNNYTKVCIFAACTTPARTRRRAPAPALRIRIYINKAHLLLGLLGFWLLGCFWGVCFWGYLLILIVIWLLVTLTVTLPIFITISRFSSSSLSLLLAISSFSDNICELSLSSAFSFAIFS